MIFIDASLPRTVADELKKVREDVVFKHDIFAPGTDDSVWLRRVGIEGWLAITHDKHIIPFRSIDVIELPPPPLSTTSSR